VAELIKRNFGTVLQQQGSYIYGTEPFVTVTKVQTTPDLSMAKIYLSIYNVEDKDDIIIKMEQNVFTLKKELAYRIRKHVRRIPEISLFLDDTLDEMYKLNTLFDSIIDNEEE